jgi:integrase
MPANSAALARQKGTRKSEQAFLQLPREVPDTIPWWAEQYFRFEVTTSSSSQKVQVRDINLFVEYMNVVEKSDSRTAWTPRLSRAFQEYLRNRIVDGKRYCSDRSVNRILAHLKTFAKWIHKLKPFPLGNPMEKIKLQPIGTGLEVERALTASERRKVLDAADLLPQIGGRSRDRSRYRGTERPRHKGYRALRNRAIIYTLVETGMRRAAVTKLNVEDLDFKKKALTVEEKGGVIHSYQISNEGLQAIRDYLNEERPQDSEKWQQPALFLSPYTNPHGDGRLSVQIINDVWNEVTRIAGVEGKTPHSARHAMGRHIMEKTGNIAAVQRQLGHKNAVYSMQYSRITSEELRDVLNNR